MDRYRAESRRMAGAVDCEPSMEGAQSLALDLDQSLARLSIVDREIFLLREIGGLTYQEISKECQCTIEGVRARLHRARITLRSMLRPGIPRIPKEAEHERRK
jgi:RNA polymerase sigma factor (sigma-70 family)